MAVYKCKMCGGTIEFEQGDVVGVCDSCGTKQTLPKTSDDVIANLFNRANNLRLKCEFDKAEQIYEKSFSRMTVKQKLTGVSFFVNTASNTLRTRKLFNVSQPVTVRFSMQ